MKFIKLTNEFNEEVFINPEHIVKFSATKNAINEQLTGLTFTSGFTYFVKETPEEIMEMINGTVEQLVNSENLEEIWTTKNGTSEITDEELREMMKDPKYWKDQDLEYVKKVENGFKKLYNDK